VNMLRVPQALALIVTQLQVVEVRAL
jgi:hypothetical protein